MTKRSLSIMIMVLILVVSITPISANSTVDFEGAGNYLKDLGIFTGYEDGTLRLENNITRAEVATLMVRMMSLEERASANKGKTPFKDIAGSFWASGYISVSKEEGLMTGYPDDTFKPQANITYAEVATILVRLLGYEEKTVTEEWPIGHLRVASELGLVDHLTYENSYVVTRGDVAYMIYQALKAEVK
ncbi:S-layer homology domain-containing protein [Alkaliphilus serpentinus]|uniref:S-layer homology domain-containing protein n=1 Tax=Alkaliphilus serpentinus TaxID=1482731 RepID=A0A833HQH4_9FIRM|nr:S-layer homology domain-containing protein [Alkaliphilus serpentinus]KAB3531863.1 S-layer homology domain-containing protein [Alkaliphilus serpentinus]